MTSSDLEWLGEIFSDMKHRTVSLRQLSFLSHDLANKQTWLETNITTSYKQTNVGNRKQCPSPGWLTKKPLQICIKDTYLNWWLKSVNGAEFPRWISGFLYCWTLGLLQNLSISVWRCLWRSSTAAFHDRSSLFWQVNNKCVSKPRLAPHCRVLPPGEPNGMISCTVIPCIFWKFHNDGCIYFCRAIC